MITALLAAALMQATPAPCADADHRAFDFWIGEWTISTTNSDVAVAESVISPVADGCGIEENYHQTVGPGGVATSYHGASYSTFDAAGGVWRQFYLDSAGGVTVFEGRVVDGAMVLDAPGARPGVTQRMTVQAQPDGSVRQWGQYSRDGGATWTPGYDFTYRRRP